MVKHYHGDDADTRVVYKSKIEFFDDGPQKPVRIWSRIGRRPLVAGGNSNGDIPMMRFARSGDRGALRLLVLHDDADREFAYTAGAEDALDRARTHGWTIVSVKDDWKLSSLTCTGGRSPAGDIDARVPWFIGSGCTGGIGGLHAGQPLQTGGVVMAKPFRGVINMGDREVGRGRIRTQPGKFSIAGEGLNVGKDVGEPVTDDYPGQGPWAFTGGTIKRAAVDVSGAPFVDLAAEARMAFMRD